MIELPKITFAELRDKIPAGYNLAALTTADADPDQYLEILNNFGVPVLTEAHGVIGVLRAMETRCGNVCKRLVETGETRTLVHLVLTDSAAILNWTVFSLSPSSPR